MSNKQLFLQLIIITIVVSILTYSFTTLYMIVSIANTTTRNTMTRTSTFTTTPLIINASFKPIKTNTYIKLIGYNTTKRHNYLFEVNVYLVNLTRTDYELLVNKAVSFCEGVYRAFINENAVVNPRYCFGAKDVSEIPAKINESRIWERLENNSLALIIVVVRILNLGSDMELLGGVCGNGLFPEHYKNITYVADFIKQFKTPSYGYPVDIVVYSIEGDFLIGRSFGLCPLMGMMFKPKLGKELDDYRLYLVTRPFHGIVKVYVELENPYKNTMDKFDIMVEINIR